jgi:hypothetical protein
VLCDAHADMPAPTMPAKSSPRRDVKSSRRM